MSGVQVAGEGRILFVAMINSVHTARWVSQLAGLDLDIRLFASTLGPPHSMLRNVTVYSFSRCRPDNLDPSVRVVGLWPWRRFSWALCTALRPFRPIYLAIVIVLFRPAVVQSLEMQHSGYLALAAKTLLRHRFPRWIVTNWGSDIYLFGRRPKHARKIRRLLMSCDYYSCECKRDVCLAKDMGLTAQVLPIFPNTGGLDLERCNALRAQERTSSRHVVLVKGYTGWAGRAEVAMRAVRLCTEALVGYRILVYLADKKMQRLAEEVAAESGLRIETVPRCSHDEMLALHGQARIHIGLSISDGISTSVLEAMAMGAFPIQSNTACANEWFQDGEGGILVPPEDPQAVADAMRRALSDDRFVDSAAEQNSYVVQQRLDARLIQPQVEEMYRKLLEDARSGIP